MRVLSKLWHQICVKLDASANGSSSILGKLWAQMWYQKIRFDTNIETKRKYEVANRKYNADKKEYESYNKGFKITHINKQLFDYCENAGGGDPHYFLHDWYVAKKISESKVKKHYDIGSRIDGFVTHLLSNDYYDEITMIDIRPFVYKLPKLNFIQADATNLENIETNSIETLSSLSVIEHFGLGRYGDKVDPMACFKALRAMQRVLKPGGFLYLEVPVTNQDELHFNAHRVFCPSTILDTLDELSIKEFTYIHAEPYTLSDTKMYTLTPEEIMEKRKTNDWGLGKFDGGIFIFQKEIK